MKSDFNTPFFILPMIKAPIDRQTSFKNTKQQYHKLQTKDNNNNNNNKDK